MRILITGGFGFIGGRLAQHLSHAGNHIILGSRCKRSKPDWLPQAEVVLTDWHDSQCLEQICSGVDLVIHAAGMNAQECDADAVAALEMNGLATARLVTAAAKMHVSRFIYFSTAHVYSSPLTGIIAENTCPHNLHPYATSHLSGEYVVAAASYRRQIEGYVLRLSNAFGVPVDKDVNCWMLLVNDLCRQVVETGKMVLKTNGRQHRDFIAMSDVCNVVEYLSLSSSAGHQQSVYNIGTGRSISVYEMALLIQERYMLMYDYKPVIYRSGDGEGEKIEILEYRLNALEMIGYKVSSDYCIEIDGLLRYCYSLSGNTK